MGSPFGSALRCHLPQWGRRGALRAHISSAPSGHLPLKGKVLGVRGGIGLDSGGVRGYNGAKMTPAQAGRPKEVTTMMHIGLLGFGVVQIGLSLKSHDPSQRANGFLTLAGGVVITFAKEILTLITG